MDYDFERRRHRRVDLSLPVEGKKRQGDGWETFEQVTTTDISVNGAYFKTSRWAQVKVDDVISVSVSVPRQFADQFPFSRIVGKARVIRLETLLPQQKEDASPKQGIALEFAPDMVYLARAV